MEKTVNKSIKGISSKSWNKYIRYCKKNKLSRAGGFEAAINALERTEKEKKV